MSSENDKSKIVKLMISVIILIVIALVGTYALTIWRSTENTELTLRIGDISGFYCTKGDNIEINNIGPIFDYTIDGESTTFSIDNQTNETANVTVKFHITTITDNLKEESFKYVLMTNTNNSSYTVYTEGNFKTVNNNSSIILLDNYEVGLSSRVSFKLIIYIDGNMENPITMQGGSLVGYLDACKEDDGGDTPTITNANVPELVQGLIPVIYNESTSSWVKADSTNNNNSWYNYDNKIWANAVLVTRAYRSAYQNTSVGTTIEDEDILAFYVWIPRYKYKVWNKDKVIGTDSYNAQTTGIDIVFEDSTNSTGTISCTYSYAAPSSTVGSPNETCTGSNGDYYTHPAFTFGTEELTGFWIGKFELSSSNPEVEEYGGGNGTTLTPRILPNVASWRKNTVSNFWRVIYDMQASNNIYGLTTSRTNTDSHMLTNMEWGAVAYLTNSKYGRCTNGSCTEISKNCYGEKNLGYRTSMTGCGPMKNSGIDYDTICNAYNTTLGQTASTTGNVYGVYDMSGGADEYVMGNMSSTNGTTYTYYASDAGTNFIYNTDTIKYLTSYAYGTTCKDQTASNRGRLGDATGEVVLINNSTNINGGWYRDYTCFSYYGNSWFSRGGSAYTTPYSSSGIFSFNDEDGNSAFALSTRAALSITP